MVTVVALLLAHTVTIGQPSAPTDWLLGRFRDMVRYPLPMSGESSRRAYEQYGIQTAFIKDSAKRGEVLTYRALGELKFGNYDRAFVDYEAAVKLNPKLAGEVGWRYLFLLRDYPRALTYLQAYDDRTPNFDDPIDDYSVNYLKGRAYAGLGDYPNALKAYSLTINDRVKRVGLEWVDYRYLVARGVAYLANKQPTEALTDLEAALKNNPKSSMAYYHKGRALEQLNRTEEAKNAYRDARYFLLRGVIERDYYYEQPDVAYEEDIDEAMARLK